MSDTKQAAGWWKASDGKWYAPELAARPGKYHSDDSEAMILAAWGELHGTEDAVALVRDTQNLPADDWRRFERCRGFGSRDRPGQGMFGLAGRWMIALEINDETSDLVLGELANVKHIEAADEVLTITSNRGHVFRLVFEEPGTAANLDEEISSSLEYLDVGDPLEQGRVEHLSVVAVLAPSGGMRPQADTNVNAAGVVTQSWANLEWFVAVPGTLQEPMDRFMDRAGAAGWELVAVVPLGYQEAKTLGEALLGNLAIRDQRLSTLRAQHLYFKRLSSSAG